MKDIIEDMGYNVELSSVSAGVMWESIATGDQDFITGANLPYTHRSYWEAHKDDVEVIGVFNDGSILAITVPDYVTIDSVAEMADYADEFNSRIVGIDPGAGIMELTKEELMPNYGLGDWELSESSEAAMMAELDRAINNQEWIAITGWTPHWMYAAYDLKMLDDPDVTLGDPGELTVVGRKGFKEEFPDVTAFLENLRLTDKQLGELMYMTSVDGMDPADAVAQWIDDNQDVVDSWLP